MSWTSSASASTLSPYFSVSGASVDSSRAVAATLSPRSSAASAQMRPKPFEQPVMNQTFESAIRPPGGFAGEPRSSQAALPGPWCDHAGMRIASLVPSSTEMLFALGLGDQVVGVTHECDFPPAAAALPKLTATVMPEGLSAGEIDAAVKAIVGEGKALYSLDEERLAELAPDLIVTQAVCDVCAVSYEDVVEVAARLPGPPRVLQQDPSSLTEVLADLGRLGEAAGVGARAAALRWELGGRLDAVRASVVGAPRPRVITLEWLGPPLIRGPPGPGEIE